MHLQLPIQFPSPFSPRCTSHHQNLSLISTPLLASHPHLRNPHHQTQYFLLHYGNKTHRRPQCRLLSHISSLVYSDTSSLSTSTRKPPTSTSPITQPSSPPSTRSAFSANDTCHQSLSLLQSHTHLCQYQIDTVLSRIECTQAKKRSIND